MDEGFIQRTYRTSTWVFVLVALPLVSYGQWQWAWSVGAGALLGLGVLRLYEWLVQGFLLPRRQEARWLFVKVSVLKLPALTLILYFVVRCGWFTLPAFAAGVALVQTVIFLKAVGLYLVQLQAERRC